MVDMKQTIYSFKHQLEDQQNSYSSNLESQYKSRISALDKSIIVKDREIGKLSSAISQAKKDKSDLKRTFLLLRKSLRNWTILFMPRIRQLLSIMKEFSLLILAV